MRRYGRSTMVMDDEPIEGCVGGKDIDGNPCWPGSEPSEWAMPDFSKKAGTPWLLLGALAVAAWLAFK